jgi:ATP-dependent RNA helicase RhlE
LAYVIPILDKLMKQQKDRKGISSLIFSPTRELAVQIKEQFVKYNPDPRIKCLNLIGGVEQENQIESLLKGVDVLISTPGRLFDLTSQGFVDLSKIKTFVIDEADLMLDLGFAKDIEDALKKIPKRRQTLFFTATIDKKIKSLAYKVVKNAIRIQISKGNPVSKNVDHSVVYVEMDDKRFFLENIIKEFEQGKFIVFVRTKIRAERVQNAMKRVGVETLIFHGGKDQKNRIDTLRKFRSIESGVLVTTDLACRGIDIPNMDYVINYDLPENPENYVHRCGRTGRGNNRGMAISFCSDQEKEFLSIIEEYTGENVDVYEVSKNDYLEILKGSDDINYDWKKLLEEDENPDSW